MNGYLENITPDSLSGIIFALEGLVGSVVLLNGPTGCKFYHSATSESQMIRQLEFDPLNYPEKWYFGQPRIPCTYLDSHDYIYGSGEKLREALEYIRDNVQHNLITIVNSPGAALIGDDLAGIVNSVFTSTSSTSASFTSTPIITIETPGFSGDVCEGFETGVLALLDSLESSELKAPKSEALKSDALGSETLKSDALKPEALKPDIHPKTVNLLGLSIYQKYCTGDIIELRRLMSLCGIKINCALSGGATVDEVKKVPTASLNIVIRPEYGLKTAEYLKKRYNTPYVICETVPIGFSATEKLIYDICNLLGCDPKPAIDDSERARATAYAHISRVNSIVGLPKGARVSVEGTYSDVHAYFKFFTGYFGMVPEALNLFCPRADFAKSKLEGLLDRHQLSHILTRPILSSSQNELVFASGATIARLRNAGQQFVGIENALPGLGYIDVIPKTHLGISGALLLVEQVLNGLLL